MTDPERTGSGREQEADLNSEWICIEGETLRPWDEFASDAGLPNNLKPEAIKALQKYAEAFHLYMVHDDPGGVDDFVFRDADQAQFNLVREAVQAGKEKINGNSSGSSS